MEYNSDFKYDFIAGHKGEKHLVSVLQDEKIEVKTDFQSFKTGNVFVEYECRGKKSGIAISEAKWYSFVLSNDFIILIEKEKLKILCRAYLGTKRDILGGDNNLSRGILLPLYDFVKKRIK